MSMIAIMLFQLAYPDLPVHWGWCVWAFVWDLSMIWRD